MIENVTVGTWEYDEDVFRVMCGRLEIADVGREADISGEATMSNGHLIAAAKEMYESTKTLLRMVGDNKKRNCKPGHCHWCDRVNAAEAAVAKAEGRKP